MSNDNKKLSQLDPGGVLKSAHDFRSDSLRVINAIGSVPSEYASVVLTHNTAGSVTNATFYGVGTPEINIVRTLAAAGLNSKYFLLNPQGDYETYYIWFNVDGGGTDPAIAGAVGIEIPLLSSDSDFVVALSIALFVSKIEGFDAERCKNLVTISNNEYGVSSGVTEGDSGFTFTTQQLGTEDLIKSIDVPFSDAVRYLYNEQERRFEVEGGINADGSINVNIVNTPASNENIVISYNEISAVISSTITTVVTYTVPVGKVAYLQRAEASGENIAVFQVEINAAKQAKRRTYFGGPLTTDFVFAESTENGLELAAGDVVRIRTEHFRPMAGDFEGRIQVLEIG